MRLWVIPQGANASEGAYLSYPLADLLRLTALESYRHRAIVIGEDLGTVPAGFRERLAGAGIYGMGVLWFERNKKGFRSPRRWPSSAVAMTSTHDLPTVAGWWRGSDLATRAKYALLTGDLKHEQAERAKDRKTLWGAFKSAKVDAGAPPPPSAGQRIANAAVKYIAQTPGELALLPLEDALAVTEQPNLPGTVNQHPNWRRRYRAEATALLDAAPVRKRLVPLKRRIAQ
jgi:4-alpha-glucanotransferase